MEITAVDDTSITLAGHRLIAADLDQLIHDLAVARGRLQPPIPDDISDHDVNLVVEHEPQFIVSRAVGDDITIAIRHGALGWVAFTLSRPRAALIRDYLAKRTHDIPAAGLEDQVAGPNGPH